MNAYEEKQERKKERLEERADKARSESATRHATARGMADQIPMGQPILVGHHSEGRHRRHLDRIQSNTRKAFEADNKAAELDRRAAAVGRGGISSDDPEAVQKLKEKVAGLRASDATAKAMNKAARAARKKAGGSGTKADRDPAAIKAGVEAALAVEGVSKGLRSRLLSSLRAFPWPPDLGTNAAEIRRCEQRIEHLLATAADETTERLFGDVRLVDNVEANRVQLLFPGKPSEDTRTALKRAGFRWARSEGAWQRQRSAAALRIAEDIAKGVT